jgi:hypothetical protein
MKAKPGGPSGPKYIDRPEVSEVFADRLEHLFFDGATVRMEFTVTRTDPAQVGPGHAMTEPRQWSYTACRVVLSARGAAEMLNKMQELQGVMIRNGALQPRPATPPGEPETAGAALESPSEPEPQAATPQPAK